MIFTNYGIKPSISISPSYGPLDGGNIMRISANNAMATAHCIILFGVYSVSPFYFNSNFILFPGPRYIRGYLQHFIGIKVNGHDLSGVAKFTYLYDEAYIYNMYPRHIGLSSNSTLIGLFGDGFYSQFTTFYYNDTVINCNVINSTFANCSLPTLIQIGVGEFGACNGDMVQLNSIKRFEITFDFKINKISPNRGPNHGYTQITVFGKFFRADVNAHCRFRAVDSILLTSATVFNSTTLSCLTPANFGDNTVCVDISINGVDYSNDCLNFTYIRAPSLSNIFPTSGILEGGMIISLSGTSFLNSNSLGCKFGFNQFVRASFINSSFVACLLPRQWHQIDLNVDLTLDGISYSNNPLIFSYYSNNLNIYSLVPTIKSVNGDSNMTLLGYNFLQNSHFLPVLAIDSIF